MGILRFFSKNQYKNLFFLTWFLLCLIQAGFTELMDDEAYYWVYAHHLSWGYFDHPPMVALIIKAGYAIFHNELGVRIGMVILNLFTLILTDQLIPRKDNRLFYLLLLTMGALQIGGMLAVPDVPLIFFTALFFYIYRAFLEQQNWKNTFLLALSMALMFYSKYHGILIVGFTVLSNLNLLRVFKFYVACIITSLLFLPHLLWQYAHHWPSLQYHLVERNASSYSVNYSIEYILGQVLLFGPLAGWLVLYYAFVCPIQSAFERALKFCTVGILVFFLFSTLKGRVEANWTVMLFTPVMVLAHQSVRRKRAIRPSLKLIQYLAPATVFVVLVTRVYLVWDFLPGVEIRPELHHNKEWARTIQEKAGGRPVVFISSYQQPSKYMFYSDHGLAYSVNSRFKRRSQYNYWDTEKQLWGKQVMISSRGWGLPVTDSFRTAKGISDLYLQDPYYSYSLIQFRPAMQAVTAKPGATMGFLLQVDNGYHVPVPVDTANEAVVGYAFTMKDENFTPVKTELTISRAIERRIVRIEVKMPEQPGDYQLKFCVFAGVLPPTHNSQTIKVIIK